MKSKIKDYQLKTTSMSKKILLLFVLITNYAISQTVNDYQYVVVPSTFSIFKEKDKYNMNTTVKLLLQKYGFKAYMSNDPILNDLANANCTKLNADLVKDNRLMTTRVKIVLTDCRENVVFESAYGKSSDKDYARAYMESLRDAAKSFDKLSYKYNGKNGLIADTVTIKPATPVNDAVPTFASGNNDEVFYFAQPTANGFQVVNNEPRVIMKMFNTSEKNVFLATKEGKTGLVLSKNGQWFFEYYDNEKLVSEFLKLKF
jgi:hypothetical protein